MGDVTPDGGSGLQIRAATSRDRPAVIEMFAEHLRALGYAPDPDLDADIDGFPETYSGAGDAFLLVTEDDRAVAMGARRHGEIRRLYVRPSHRGRGLARRLVARLCRESSAGLRAIVARTNAPALRTFEASGFRPTGHSPDHPKMQHCEVLELRELPEAL